MPTTTLVPVPYRPSLPLTGNEPTGIIAGQNFKLRGTAPHVYYEAYPGSENLSEPIPTQALTGTLSFSAASTTVTGTGTSFLDELHIGQEVFCNTDSLRVAELISQTSFRAGRLPTVSTTTQAATLPANLFPLDINRGSLIWGNGIHFDKGTIVAVGDGPLYRNGVVLSGDSLVATRSAQIAIYDSTTENYDLQSIGFSAAPTAPAITITASGGSKNMSLGFYSFRAAYYSSVTTGYGNPTETILDTGAANVPFNLVAANSQWVVDFTTDVGSRPTNATGYIVYISPFTGSSDISAVNAIQGGWYEAIRVEFADLSSEAVTFEVTDATLTTLVSFDNTAPPDAEFVVTLDNYIVLISTNGKGVNSGSRITTTSPGPFVSPMKADNLDGYPATLQVPTEKGEVIIGALSAAGRVFVQTANTLQAVSSTGLPSAPMVCRPFWQRGFASPNTLTFVDDTLYGFTTKGPYRSIATGDTASESNDFASDVATEMATWNPSHVFVESDSTAEEVCFIHSAARKNADGYWESDILPYSLQYRAWMPTVVLTDSTRDMIVSGAANVNGFLEFIAGGRRASTTDQWDTWRYNTGSSQSVSCYLAWQFTDNGFELIAKRLRKLRPKGKFKAGATLDIYATTPDTEIDIDALEAGTGSAFSYSLASSTDVKQYGIQKSRVRNAMMWTARLSCTANWDGSSELKDQLHEIAVLISISGAER